MGRRSAGAHGLMTTQGLTSEQVEMLLRPIKARRVMQAQGQSHIPAYDIVAHLNRLFGFGGWDKEIKAIDLVEERNDVPGKNGWYVTYRCLMRLTIKSESGQVVAIREDGACGSAQNQPSLGDAHDLAYKNAISYAIKRCAKDWGDQFGLSLYNKGETGALVGTTLVGRETAGSSGRFDVQDHAPTPLSLGNDERQESNSPGEAAGSTATASPAPEGRGVASQTSNNNGVSRPVGGGRSAPAGLSAAEDRRRKHVNAAMGKAGITGDDRHVLIRFATKGAAASSAGLSAEQESQVVTTAQAVVDGFVVLTYQLDGSPAFAVSEPVDAVTAAAKAGTL